MLVLLVFGFLSGIVTILSPCILPVLPIVLSGGIGGGKRRPLGVILGFTAGFTVFTLALSALVRAFGIPADALRFAAVVVIVFFGLVLLVPPLRDRFELLTSRLASARGSGSGAQGSQKPRTGFWSGIPVGLSLGLVWTPCVGPIMASVIGLAATQRVDGAAVLITLAYAAGTSVPMFAVMAGGRALLSKVPALTRNTGRIQKAFGVIMIVIGIGIGFGWDRKFQTAVLAAFPSYGSGLTALEDIAPVRSAIENRDTRGPGSTESGPVPGGSMKALTGSGTMAALAGAGTAGSEPVFRGAGSSRPEPGKTGNYGTAPGITAEGPWFNTGGIAPDGSGTLPLTMEELRGKVVLIDFWTYSCVNCVRTLPYLRAWYEAYRDQGLVIIGVHTPEFEFEKSPANVEKAMKELGVTWPVVLDNDWRQWNAYANRYWPAHYFIDASGRVRYFHFGEGRYEESERVIRELLKEAGASVKKGTVSSPAVSISARTPETYLGYWRSAGFVSPETPLRDAPAAYSAEKAPANGEWSLSGTWTVRGQYIVPESDGKLELGFDAKNVFLVMEPEEAGGIVNVEVDGAKPADTPDVENGVLRPEASRMYHLVGLKQSGAHVLSLEVRGRIRLFAFTFG